MRLITAHRILIAAAIAFFLFYASVQLRRHLASGEVAALAQTACRWWSPACSSSTTGGSPSGGTGGPDL